MVGDGTTGTVRGSAIGIADVTMIVTMTEETTEAAHLEGMDRREVMIREVAGPTEMVWVATLEAAAACTTTA